MKRLFFFCSLLFLVTPAFGAGGTCPTGANYLDLTNPSNGGGLGSITLSTLGITSCYYISANGADTNNGTSESTPWLHAPGMPNFGGSYTFTAGDGIILRGGDTWHVSSGTPATGGSWTYSHTCNSTNPCYIGVDFTWFSGGSFARPIINEDNPLTTSKPASCSHADDGTNRIGLSGGNYIILDMIEEIGDCSSGASGGNIINTGAGKHNIVERAYIHGWSIATGASDDSRTAIGNGNGNLSDADNRLLFNVVDGSDSTFGTVCTASSCVPTTCGNNATGCATMWAISSAADLEYNVVRHASQGVQAGTAIIVHDNLFEYLFNPAFGNRHGNVFEINGGTACSTLLFYNNIFRDTTEGVGFWPQCPEIIVFNNFFGNSGHFPPGDSNEIMGSPPGSSGSGVVTYYYYNNTTDATVAARSAPSNPSTPSWASGSTITAENNHIVGFTSPFSHFFGVGSGNTQTIVDNGGEVYQTTAVANGQGYVLSNDYAPRAGTNATVGAGNNVTSAFCSSVVGAINSGAQAECEAGTSSAVMEASAWGGLMASYPAITVNARPSSGAWDTGAYEFSSVTQASAPSCTPGTGSYTSTQTVTCTNPNTGTTVMCYTTNGATPATNGAGTGCTTGTKYTTTISISTSSTLQIIAGTSTLTDSTVSSYTYTIDPQAATPSCTPGSGQYSAQQSVTCTDSSSGAIMCATKDQSTPATNGTTGCSNGTLYSGSITIPTALTLNVVAGGTGYTDSAVATYVYTGLLSYVTGFAADETETTSGSWTFSYAPTNANDAIPIYVQCHPSTGTITGVSLSASGWTITPLQTVNTGANDWGASFGAIAPNTSSATFTATFTGASNCSHFAIVMLDEFSGNNTAGGTTTFNATSSSAGTAGTCNQTAANLTPAVNNEAAWFACTDNASAATLPFSEGSTDNGGQMTEYQTLLGQTGVAQTPAYTSTSGTYLVMGVAIAPPSSGTVANPSFSLTAGSYLGSQLETLSDSTSLATICYTVDGSTPAAATAGTCSHGTTYTIPFLITQPSPTVKAIGTLGGSTNSSVVSASYTITNAAQLPQIAVDNNEAIDGLTYVAPQYELNLGTQTWTVGPPPTSGPASCTTSFHVPYWTVGSPTVAGLQSAIVDIEACHTNSANAVGIILDIPPFNYSAAFGLYLPQSGTVALAPGNSFLVLRSTLDANVPNGTTVCSHGLQDNLATSADIGLDNQDCAGNAMYYQLGSTLAPITAASESSTTVTITSTLNPAFGSVVAVAGVLPTGYNGLFTVTSTSSSSFQYTTTSGLGAGTAFGTASYGNITNISAGALTLANGVVTNTSNYNDVANLWTVEGTGGAAFRACAPVGGGSLSSNVPACTSTTLAPQGWFIESAEMRLQAGYTAQQDILQMAGSGSETSTSQYPSHVHFRKIWLHGDWANLTVGRNKILDAFALTGSYISMLDSQCSELEEPGNDHHCGSAEGPGPYKFNHNWYEGGSSGCVAAGGQTGAGPSVFGLIPFSDVEFRRNRCTWPYAWLGQNTVPASNTVYSGQSLEKKNIVEQKALQRVLFDGNIFENTDGSGGQQGPLGDWNVRNSSVGFGTNYLPTVTDLTLSHNIFRNSCEGFETDKSSGSSGNGGGVSYGVHRMLVQNNLIYSVTTGNPGCGTVANSKGIQLSNGASTQWQGNVSIESTGTQGTFQALCAVAPTAPGTCKGQILSVTVGTLTGCSGNGNFTVSAPNISGGIQATESYTCSGGTFTLVAGNPGSGYTSAPTMTPATGSGAPVVTLVSSSVAPSTGYQVLDMNLGDPIPITMCNTSGLNTVTTASYGGKILPNEVGPLATVGSAAWTGTPITANLTVSYPFVFTANASDTSGYCTITNVQGGPSQFYFQHNTFITDSLQAITSNNSPNNEFNFQIDSQFRDSIVLGGGWTTSQGEGTPTEKVNSDITSLTIDHMVWPGRTASSYTEYGNNPAFPDSAGCTGAGCHPPSTMYYPTTSYCTGASPTSACVGFLGAMSASSMPLTLADYHNFALASGSSFKAGAADQASDGTDMGPSMAAVDSAQTLNQYPGFFPDTLPTFTCSPATVPATHAGNINLTCTGVFTAWTSGTVFTVSGAAFVSSSNTSATQETVIITTSTAGTATINDTTDSISTTIAVDTAGLTISPTTGATSTTPTETLTCTGSPAPCLWSSESLSGLFTVSGGSGASLSGCSVSTDTSASCTLGTGTLPGTLTIEDQSTTATAPFTVTGSPTTQQFHLGCPVGTSCPSGHFKITGGVIQ